jgi:hypothetical protein
MAPPRLRNRVLDSDDDDSVMAGSDESQKQNREENPIVVSDSENDADVDTEVREVTRGTRMLMVAVEGGQRFLLWILARLGTDKSVL